MKTIYDFKKGDAVVRIIPAKSLGPMISMFTGEAVERGGDRSYMGDELIFMGIANGQIYLQRTNEIDIKIFGNKLIDLSIDLWGDGWDNYIDPLTLVSDIVHENDLEVRIKEAIDNEDYELADKLKRKLMGD